MATKRRSPTISAARKHRPRVYIETSVVSYLTARPSRDLIVAGNELSTREWWDQRDRFELYVSRLVIDEAGRGDGAASALRLDALRDVPVLEIFEEAQSLAGELLRAAALPAGAKGDALHVALAAVHGMDHLVTWNCAHIANATMRPRIEAVCRAAGFEPPVICTPLELGGGTSHAIP